jgi:hypothetical protein
MDLASASLPVANPEGPLKALKPQQRREPRGTAAGPRISRPPARKGARVVRRNPPSPSCCQTSPPSSASHVRVPGNRSQAGAPRGCPLPSNTPCVQVASWPACKPSLIVRCPGMHHALACTTHASAVPPRPRSPVQPQRACRPQPQPASPNSSTRHPRCASITGQLGKPIAGQSLSSPANVSPMQSHDRFNSLPPHRRLNTRPEAPAFASRPPNYPTNHECRPTRIY